MHNMKEPGMSTMLGEISHFCLAAALPFQKNVCTFELESKTVSNA